MNIVKVPGESKLSCVRESLWVSLAHASLDFMMAAHQCACVTVGVLLDKVVCVNTEHVTRALAHACGCLHPQPSRAPLCLVWLS